MTSPTLLQQLTERAGQLYSLPAVALEVLDLTAQPHIDAHALKQCIERDPALTSKILKVVNSSLFGLSRKVSDLHQAIAMLGIKPLKMLVLGFSLPKELYQSLEQPALSRYWRHALIKAVACRELAERVWRQPGDEAFIAGLLQDIGQLVLVQQVGEPFLKFLEQAHLEPRPLVELELEAMGFDHAVLSARLLEKWGLPPLFVRAVAQPADATVISRLPEMERPLSEIVHTGELIARFLTRRPGTSLEQILAVGALYRSLNYEQLQDIIDHLELKVTALGEVLALYQPAGPPFSEILSQAHARLAEVAEGASAELSTGVATEARLLNETRRLSEELKAAVSRNAGVAPPLRSGGSTAAFGSGVATLERRSTMTRTEPQAEIGLAPRIAAAIARGREARQSVSLLLVQIDRYAELVFTQGVERATRIESAVPRIVSAAVRGQGMCLAVGEARYAIVCDDCDRRQATETARQIVRDVKSQIPTRSDGAEIPLTLSIGAATLASCPRNFPPQDLITAAERCLYGAQAGGGSAVKSIEL